MINNWAVTKLKNILQYIQPTKYIVNSTNYDDKYEIPVLTPGKSFILGYTNEKKNIFDQLPAIIFDDFTTSSKFVNFPFKVKSSAMKILVPTSSLVNIKYIFYFIKTLRINATTHKRYWISIFSQLPIKIAPLPEQNRIVDKIEELFSELDNAVENLKKIKEQLKVYRQAVLKYAFDGKFNKEKHFKIKYCSFSDICEINPSKNEVKSYDDNFEVSFLPMIYISKKGIILKQEIRKIKKVKKGFTYFRNGDILLAKITPCFENGKKAIAKDLKNGIGFGSTEFHILRPKKEVTSKWIYYAISLEDFRNKAISQMTGTAGQKRVPKKVVESFKISIPPKSFQIQIVQEIESRLSQCDKIEKEINNSLQQADALRQSILKKAFEGKLVPQDPNDEPAEALLTQIKKQKGV